MLIPSPLQAEAKARGYVGLLRGRYLVDGGCCLP